MEDSKLDKKIDEKIEEKLKQKIKNNRAESEAEDSDNPGLSRRDFLKKMGLGAAGIGALSILPNASAFNIRTSNPLQYFGDDQNNPNFAVKSNGSLEAEKINTNIANIKNVTITQDSVSEMTHHIGDRELANAGETLTIFDVTDPINIIYGSIHGGEFDDVEVTWADGTTNTLSSSSGGFPGRIQANNDNNDNFQAFYLPPVLNITKLTVTARGGSQTYFGWDVVTK